MRSQDIKTRNLPEYDGKMRSIRVKPVSFLILCIAVGCYMIYAEDILATAGLVLILVALFALTLMPDRILAQFTSEYLILYDSRHQDECSLIYWEDMVSWSYEWHMSSDLLVVNLVDGSSRTCDMYRKSTVARLMNHFAPGKEIKSVRIKEGKNT